MVLSYIFGDNPLFRFSVYLSVGVAAGFAGAVALRNVIFPNLIFPLFKLVDGDYSIPSLVSIVPFFLSLTLLTKMSPRLGKIGNVAMAYLVGIGAGVAILGAILGTLFPQIQATINQFDLSMLPEDNPGEWLLSIFSRVISLLGTMLTLIYFHFSTRQNTVTNAPQAPWLTGLASVGRLFIAVTFGVVFAGVYTAALTALISRLNALIEYIYSILGFLGIA
jgi:hypothetical protein